MFRLVLATLVVTLAASQARAETNDLSVSVSPFLVFVPLGEVTAEVHVTDQIGIAAIGGVGRFHDPDTNLPVSLYEGGASARYYVTGDFDTGIQLGGEAVYLHASTTAMDVEILAAGLGRSPFAGYKWTHRSGLTLEGQLGATFMVARGRSDAGASASRRDVLPMLNLQLGYSF